MSADQPATVFFDLIHAPDGWRCLFTLPDRRHYWFNNSADLARAAAHLDAKGLAVFHACATFADKQRKQDSVLAIKCFWLDIDAGAGKPYASAGEAYQALKSWLARTTLPEPVVVASGGGLHVYWALDAALSLAQWQPRAERLRALAVEHGLQIDPGSTIDSARILRPPGTHNRKLLDDFGKKTADVGGFPREVRAGPLRGPYPLATFDDLGTTEVVTAVPSFLKGVMSDASILEIGAPADQPSDPELIAARCAQVRRLWESNGQLPEPEWYAVLGVLAYAGAAGRDAAHKHSSGDARYTRADTDAKLNQYIANASGPTTCARFGHLVNGPCLLCPSAGKITSPIQLGRDVPAATTAPAPAADALPRLPEGFGWRGTRLCADREPTDEDPRNYIILSEYPVLIDELQELERSHTVSMAMRSWEPMTQSWREFMLNNGDLVAQGGASKVAQHGVVIGQKRWPDFVRYANACTIEHRASKHYGTRYEQFGWKTANGVPAFVVGDELFRANEAPQRVRGTDEIERRGRLMAAQGNASAWAEAASKLIRHEGMEAHGFMLLCAFAAPLYRFTGEPGAPLVHGTTRSSGKGKTTMQRAGASLWGVAEATSVIERDTMVAKFITLGTLCHLPIFFDEMRFTTPDETKHYVLQATLGRDKQRGRADGGLRTDHLDWSTIHISASNLSLTDTVRADGAETAQAARIFEFTLNLPDGVKTTDGDAIMRVLQENRGTMGRAFIQHTLDNYAWVEKAVLDRMKHYEQRMGAGPDERFILRLFACVDVAGALIRRFGLLAIDLDKIMAWAVDVQRGNTQRMTLETSGDAAATLSQMINDLIPNTLIVEKAMTPGKPQSQPPNREFRGPLLARLEREGRSLLIADKAVRKWMQEHNYSFTETQKELVEMKVLTAARVRRGLGAGTPLSVGQVWCWQVDGAHPALAEAIEGVVEDPPPVSGNVVALRGRG